MGDAVSSKRYLSSHFTLEELTRSSVASKHGLKNRPNNEQLFNLEQLAQSLEQVRQAVGDRPVTILSGFRTTRLNALVGGSRNSAHMRGLAADISVKGLTPKQVALYIIEADVEFDQLILHPEQQFVHFGLSENPRHEVLTARPDKTYARGIHEQVA